MQKKTGVHFYINIANFDDVAEKEEAATQEVKHSIHELDTFFSSVEAYGLKHYPGLFRVEKITGSRLHMYVENDSVPKTFEIVAAVTKYAFELAGHLNVNVSKYKTLLPFCIHAGACYGPFYEFEFKRKDADEMTTIGFAANYAAKLQNMANLSRVLISENIYDSLTADQKKCFSRLTPTAIRKYDQTCCYDAEIANLPVRYNFKRDFERAVEIARKVDLQNMYFRSANQPLSYRNLSKTECKKINGIPLFADVRDFTSQFDEDGANLEEMAVKTQNILTAMYDVVEERNGIHVQFQGDREMALFHDYGDYSCVVDAVIAGLKIIDAVKGYQVSVGVGQSIGRLFAAKIGARGEKDNILLGRTVGEADKNEDEYAEKNQLVLSADLYEKLKQNDSGLSSLFKKKNGGVYYTESGYRGYLSQESRKQLKHDNAHNNYNKAWGDSLTEIESARKYVKDVFADIQQARETYPFIEATLLPTVDPVPIQLKVAAVNKSLLERTHAKREDFAGPYSRELEIIVPFDYKKAGCKVYGGKWIDTKLVKEEYQHFNDKRKDGCYLFCVGVPESFPQMENVILENIRTAEKMLMAYELYQTGETKSLELNAYSHGTKGINEYAKDKKRYKGK